MILQTAQGLLFEIQKWGCYFLSIAYFCEKDNGEPFTVDDLNKAFKDLLKVKAVDIECTVLNPDAIIARLNGKGKKFKGKADAKYICAGNEFEIQEWYNIATNYTHFVAGDGKGDVLWDSYGHSRTVREGKLTGKRIFIQEGNT